MSLLEKLQQNLKQLNEAEPAVNPSVFNDPLALRTAWSPLVPGGASFRTHRLVRVEGEGLELRKSLGSFLFGGLFALIGCAPVVVGLKNATNGELAGGVWASVLGALFVGVGAWVAWPSRLAFDGLARVVQLKSGPVPFGEIYALQIVRERISGKTSYWSYELNLVLRDGERKNVVDHGNLESLRTDARTLRDLVGCRLWDATLHQH